MWSLFLLKNVSYDNLHEIVNDWKKIIFDHNSCKVKEHFAKKVALYFDNSIIFHPKRDIHYNLMEALSNSEKEMASADILFPQIHLYFMPTEIKDSFFLITYGLPSELLKCIPYNIELIEKNASPINESEEKFKNKCWGTLVFDISLVSYAGAWINFTPNLEERTKLQVEYILLNMYCKKNNVSLVDKIEFEKNIKNHPQYNDLYTKILKIMPKIENNMEQEFRVSRIKNKLKTKK